MKPRGTYYVAPARGRIQQTHTSEPKTDRQNGDGLQLRTVGHLISLHSLSEGSIGATPFHTGQHVQCH